MSALLLAATLATAASVIVSACVAYILISFRRSGHLLAARIGRQPVALVVISPRSFHHRHVRSTRAHNSLRPAFAR